MSGEWIALGGMLLSLAQLSLDVLGGAEQSAGRERGVDADHGIDKRVLALEAPRLGIVQSRLAHHGANLLCNELHSPTDVLFPVTQV